MCDSIFTNISSPEVTYLNFLKQGSNPRIKHLFKNYRRANRYQYVTLKEIQVQQPPICETSKGKKGKSEIKGDQKLQFQYSKCRVFKDNSGCADKSDPGLVTPAGHGLASGEGRCSGACAIIPSDLRSAIHSAYQGVNFSDPVDPTPVELPQIDEDGVIRIERASGIMTGEQNDQTDWECGNCSSNSEAGIFSDETDLKNFEKKNSKPARKLKVKNVIKRWIKLNKGKK